jgi:nucleotide-binding universal stress UspA family protein
MYKHILIPTDGSQTAAKAVSAGIDFARESGASITFFTAVPEYEVPLASEVMAHKPVMSLEEHERRSAEKARAILAPALERARTCGVAFDADHALSNKPYEAIIDAARRQGCDAIFMASHARKGLSRLVHGSQTIDVLTHSDIPTLVVR